MRTSIRFLLALLILFSMGSGVKCQVTQGEFQHVASISDQLGAPARVAIDRHDYLYVTDGFKKCIHRYDPTGAYLSSVSFEGNPVSVAVSDDDILYIGDGNTGNIYKMDQTGAASLFYSGCGFPNDMVFSPQGQLYVSDSKFDKVLAINQGGELIQTIGAGTLHYPTGIAFDARNNHVIVGVQGAVTGNLQTRVYIYETNGTLVSSFGSYGYADGRFYRVQGITSGRCGNIYVCEPFQGNVSVFSEEGTFITRFGEFGTQSGQLNVPMDVAFDSQDRVILASMNNGAVEVFSINDPLPSATLPNLFQILCEGETTGVPVQFTGSAPWSFTYTRNNGNPVTVNNVTTNPYLLTLSQAGTYKITALSDAIQQGHCFSGGVTLEVTPAPTALMLSHLDSICEGQNAEIPVQLSGTPPWTIQYIYNDLSPVSVTASSSPFYLKVSEPGYYLLQSVSDVHCTNSTQDEMFQLKVAPKPLPSFTYAATSLTISFINTSTGVSGCYWNFGDGHSSSQLSPVHHYEDPGVYSVSMYAWNPLCKAKKTIRTVVVSEQGNGSDMVTKESEPGISLNSDLLQTDIQIFPNPTQGIAFIEISGGLPSDLQIEVINPTGQCVLSRRTEVMGSTLENQTTEPLDLSSFAGGIYTVRLVSAGLLKTFKLVLNP